MTETRKTESVKIHGGRIKKKEYVRWEKLAETYQAGSVWELMRNATRFFAEYHPEIMQLAANTMRKEAEHGDTLASDC